MAAKKARKKAGAKDRKQKDRRSMAQRADRHALYQRAVQDPEYDVDFLRDVYRRVRKREPRHLREDFCGTALLCCHWAALGEDYTAEGFDLHRPTLRWGMKHNLRPLGESAGRIVLHQEDVRTAGRRPADVLCAQNFSYQVFHRRAEMRDYLEAVHRHLAEDGVFVLDMYGGWESVEELEEERWIDDDTIYVWDQVSYAPVTGRQRCAIHFRFADGSELTNAFVYDWRYWTMAEMKELLEEVGFARVDAWFEELDEEGDGTGNFARSRKGMNCESWLAYLVAYR